MAVIQSKFPADIPKANVGQLEGSGKDIGDLKAHAALSAGLACKFRNDVQSNPIAVELGVDQVGGKVSNFAGITALRQQNIGGGYKAGDFVGRRVGGLVYVAVTAAVKKNDPVRISAAAGTFNSAAESAANPTLEDAHFFDAAAAGGVARVFMAAGAMKVA